MPLRRILALFYVLIASCLGVSAADTGAALQCFKTGDYKTAIPLLQAARSESVQPVAVKAALLSALVYEGRVDDATNLAAALEQEAATDPALMVARGEFLFYMGDMGGSEKLFREVIRIQENNARATYGLYRVFHAASLYKSARLLCMRAHSLDPDDALITLDFLHYTVGPRRRDLIGPFMQAHPWFAQVTHFESERESAAAVREKLAEEKAFQLQGAIADATVPLTVLMSSGTRARGIGIVVSIDGGKPLHLMLDTGASGILLTQQAVDKAGLKHLGTAQSWGIGDRGAQKGFFAVSNDCSIGTLKYKNCIFRAIEGKGRIAGEEDGLFGTDFFDDYLIHLDFQRHHITLKPLPQRPETPQGFDRTVPPGEEDFTPVFRFGHALCLPTLVNRKSPGLFVIDTGSGQSMMDSTFARLSTKIHGNESTRVKGISGSVKEVYEADKAELQFGHFRQNNLGLLSVDLNHSGDRHEEVRLSGLLGLPVLAMFRLDIDYRNGLVKFDYLGR